MKRVWVSGWGLRVSLVARLVLRILGAPEFDSPLPRSIETVVFGGGCSREALVNVSRDPGVDRLLGESK